MARETTTDVEMEANNSPPTEEETGSSEKPEPGKKGGEGTDLLTLEDIKEQVKHIEKAVSTKEPRYMTRALRSLVPLRRKLNHTILRKAVVGYSPLASVRRDAVLAFLDEPMDTDVVIPHSIYFQPMDIVVINRKIPMDADIITPLRGRSTKGTPFPLLPEIEMYIHLLLLIHLIDTKRYEEAVKCSDVLLERVLSQNRRSLDMLAAKCYFYHSRAYELTDQLDKIRVFLHTRLRTCTLRNDFEGQAALLNLLLRNYLHHNLYDQADKLVSKSTFPESVSNNEWARFMYYLGRIKAMQLDYSEAHKNLLTASRKAPQHTAVGFKQTVHKFLIVVELLLGEIPDRSVFRHQSLRKTLAPYFILTQAVRTGNLAKFNEVLSRHGSKFQSESTFTLIIRLRHNVIKTGVRMISMSYSRISLGDIAQKLLLDSSEDAEYIVAKAIRDGVIEASIDHELGYVQSKENIDLYSTREPMAAFHQRISFCLDIHNQSVKAMRFPPKSYNNDLESAEERREREQQELESAKEIADEDFDGFP